MILGCEAQEGVLLGRHRAPDVYLPRGESRACHEGDWIRACAIQPFRKRILVCFLLLRYFLPRSVSILFFLTSVADLHFSYAFRLDKRVVNISQPARNFADEVEMSVGVVMSRVRLATAAPVMSLQSATATRVDPSARSLSTPSSPPSFALNPLQLFLQQQQQLMALFGASQLAAQPQHTPLSSVVPTFNLNMQWPTGNPSTPSPTVDNSRKRNREENDSPPSSPSKLPRAEAASDVSDAVAKATSEQAKPIAQ